MCYPCTCCNDCGKFDKYAELVKQTNDASLQNTDQTNAGTSDELLSNKQETKFMYEQATSVEV